MMNPILVKYKLGLSGFAPTQATSGSAAFDLIMPHGEGPIRILPNPPTWIDFNVSVEIPPGYCGILQVRSSVGTKKGIYLLNGFGLIDSDYRGPIVACLASRNFTTHLPNPELNPGDAICQLIILPIAMTNWQEYLTLSETSRGEGGFGSTDSSRKENKDASADSNIRQKCQGAWKRIQLPVGIESKAASPRFEKWTFFPIGLRTRTYALLQRCRAFIRKML